MYFSACVGEYPEKEIRGDFSQEDCTPSKKRQRAVLWLHAPGKELGWHATLCMCINRMDIECAELVALPKNISCRTFPVSAADET